MSINERTKYRIANKWNNETKKFDQNQFDFEDKGSFAFGKMSWSVKKTDKKDQSVSFDNSSIKFICFGEAKELIANNLSSKFTVEASLLNKPYKGQDDKWKDSWQLTIFKAEIAEQGEVKPAEKSINLNDVDENGDFDLNDDIPW